MDTVECPYCEEEVEICHDDGAYYDENNRRSIECEHCEKHFMVTSEVSWNFSGEKADCLNGSEHEWKKKYNPSHHPNLIHKEICELCDEERSIKIAPFTEETK